MKELDIDRAQHMTSTMIKTYPSIIKIIELGITANNFCFKPISDDNIHKMIQNIDSS